MKLTELPDKLRRLFRPVHDGKAVDPEKADPRGPGHPPSGITHLPHWDRQSVRHIPLEPFERGNASTARRELSKTVPAGVATSITHHADTAAWRPATQRSMQILAIDRSGEALVERSTYTLHTARARAYAVTSLRDAIAQYEDCAGAPIDAGALRALRVEPMTAERLAPAPPGAKPNVARTLEPAQPGQTYRGFINSVGATTVHQYVNESTCIVHDLGALVGLDVQDLLWQDVEIRYPHGHVGLIQTPTVIDPQLSSLEWATPASDHDRTDRADLAS